MKITVILCTYNRCQSLAKTLDSLIGSALSAPAEWQVLVVDNNSKDQTRAVVEEFARRYEGRFQYLFERQQGKSYALNAGIRAAQGDILAFIDDDVIVAEGWLQNLTANLGDNEWAGAGGPVLPPADFSRPPWLSSTSTFAFGPLAEFHPSIEVGQMTLSPVGTNMAFRKSVFQKHGDFRTDLGPRPGNEIRSEDIEFGRRLIVAGERLRYEPSAIVYHPVTNARLQKKYFLAWWFDKGRAEVRQLGMQPNVNRFLGVPLKLFRDITIEAVRWVVAGKTSERFVCKLKVWCYAGEAFESFLHRDDAGRKRLEPDANPTSNPELR
ncbi:MAG: glycosyltransferase family 2 protein [Candidatus Acidiferrales bacterium]